MDLQTGKPHVMFSFQIGEMRLFLADPRRSSDIDQQSTDGMMCCAAASSLWECSTPELQEFDRCGKVQTDAVVGKNLSSLSSFRFVEITDLQGKGLCLKCSWALGHPQLVLNLSWKVFSPCFLFSTKVVDGIPLDTRLISPYF